MIVTILRLLLTVGAASLLSCGGGSAVDIPVNWSITTSFTRIDNPTGLDPFVVDAIIANNDVPTAGLAPSVTITRGALGAVVDQGDGHYRFTITPSQTGEYPVTVSHQGIDHTRTALVLLSVDSAWGQPMAVSGLVNTEGYEDGVTITPDGEYLFVQTGPQYFSGLFVFLAARANGGCGANRLVPTICRHPWLDTLPGPYTAPERPGFFDGRFAGTTFLHNANSWGIGVDQAPNFAFATMFYGFKRQPDGRFTEPFYVAFDDVNDALANPFGMSFRMNANGTATLIFAHDDGDPSGAVDQDNNAVTPDVDSRFDIYTMDIPLGQDTLLGRYSVAQPPLRTGFFPATRVPFDAVGPDGLYGTQGNPHLYTSLNGTVHSIWTDDEHDGNDNDPGNDADLGDISVYTLDAGTFPNGTWSKTVLPPVINGGPFQIQPFFTGSGLYYTQETDILFAAYSGADTSTGYATAANWQTPSVILGKDVGDTPLGKIVAIGEPTIASRNGQTTLYFVYGYVRAVDPVTGIADINLQAGYIDQN